jgi:hypothetical protein
MATQVLKQTRTKVFRVTVWFQASYILMTAIWPLADIRSFMEVTGYKTDVWLVKTVGALLIPVAICLFSYLLIDTDRRPAMLLGGLTAIAFISIDFYYALTDVIPDIYVLDGVVEIIFLVLWIFIWFSDRRRN